MSEYGVTNSLFRIQLCENRREGYAGTIPWSFRPGIGQIRLDVNKYPSPYKWGVSPAERGFLAEPDFFFPACPSALMPSFFAATIGHFGHWGMPPALLTTPNRAHSCLRAVLFAPIRIERSAAAFR